MSDTKKPGYDPVEPLGKLLASPRHPQPSGEEHPTDPGTMVTVAYVQAKVAEAREAAKRGNWLSGWAAGISGIAVAVGICFTLWFRIEANAEEKAAKAKAEAVAAADAGVELKLGPIRTDIAVIKTKLEQLEQSQSRSEGKQDEMLRILKAHK